MNVFDLSAKLTLDSTEYTDGMEKASGASQSFASKLGSGLANTAKVAAATLAAMSAASVALGKSLYGAVKEAADFGDNVDKMSQKIGISTDSYQEWSYVMDLCGTNVDNLQTGMKTLSKVITDAGNGSDRAAGKLAAVGLSMEDLAGLTQEQQLDKVVEALQGMGEGADRTAAATDLLGRSATDMAALLNMSTDEMAKLKDEAHKYGMVMAEDAVKKSAAFKDSLTKLSGTFKGVKNTMMGDFMPGLTEVIDGFSDLLAGVDGADDKIASGMGALVDEIGKLAPKITKIIGTVLPSIIKTLPGIMTSLGKAIGDLIPTLLPAIGEAVMELIKALADMSGDFVPNLIEFLTGMITGMINAIPQVIDAVWTIVTNIFSALVDMDWVSIGSQILSALQNAIGETAELVFGSDTSILDGILSGIINGVAKLGEIAIQIVSGLVKWLMDENVLGGLLDGVTTLLGKIVSLVVENLPLLLEAATNIVTQICTYLMDEDVLSNLLNGVLSIISSIITFIVDNSAMLIDAAIEIVTSLADFLLQDDVFTNMVSALFDFVMEIVTHLIEYAPNIISFALELINKLGESLVKLVNQLIPDLQDFLWYIVSWLTGKGDAFEATGRGWGERLAKGLKDAFFEVLKVLFSLGDMSGGLNLDAGNKILDNMSEYGFDVSHWYDGVTEAYTNSYKKQLGAYGDMIDTSDINNIMTGITGFDMGAIQKTRESQTTNIYIQSTAQTVDQAYQDAQAATKFSGISGMPSSARTAMAGG